MPGPRGDRGREGPPGKSGPQGIKRMKGQQGLLGMKGERGIAGMTGERGAVGIKGERGIVGMKGERGAVRMKGEPGIVGMKGERGAQQNATNLRSGSIFDCAFNKLQSNSALRVSFQGNMRVYGSSIKCNRWYFKFNGNECSGPMAIDTVVYNNMVIWDP
ncbi:unnamed protein product [Porites lobata]|uniref:CTHRC1 C-terminal domain-containing protein n=1 Tax=Porites lobata TaxID=104759 RepID=A0ABN8QT69_9CNID|nr:unnamed protein product [Porites lobata]